MPLKVGSALFFLSFYQKRFSSMESVSSSSCKFAWWDPQDEVGVKIDIDADTLIANYGRGILGRTALVPRMA